MTESSQRLTETIERIASHQDIQQLAARYALAVDTKDLVAIADLFVVDVDAGSEWGVGRSAIRDFYRVALSKFYRSIHLISGHVINFSVADHAHGSVYCRAEHEQGLNWGIWVARYDDDYERWNGSWYFRRRRPRALYTTEILSRPRGPGFLQGWSSGGPEGTDSLGLTAALPGSAATFREYWAQFPVEHVRALTVDPVDP